MKTVEKVLTALFCVLICLCVVIHFCVGNSSAGIAWINVVLWFAIAQYNRNQADYYMGVYEKLYDIASNTFERLRAISDTPKQPEPQEDRDEENIH